MVAMLAGAVDAAASARATSKVAADIIAIPTRGSRSLRISTSRCLWQVEKATCPRRSCDIRATTQM
jgi:hypothetical protein